VISMQTSRILGLKLKTSHSSIGTLDIKFPSGKYAKTVAFAIVCTAEHGLPLGGVDAIRITFRFGPFATALTSFRLRTT